VYNLLCSFYLVAYLKFFFGFFLEEGRGLSYFFGVVGGLQSSCLEEASQLGSVPCTASDVKIAKVTLASAPSDSSGNPLPSKACDSYLFLC
jgi:hypothetical protein